MEIKKYLNVLRKYVLNPDYRFLINAGLGWYNSMPDNVFLERKFKILMGKDLNLENPQTFNEKLQWLKLYNRKSEYTMMVDKYKVRQYIADTIGEQYLIPLLGVWDDPDEIDFESLPDQFVLKCNHNSGTGMCICKDKSKLDIKEVRKGLKRGLAENYYLLGREWPYKDVPRKIIAEQYMEDPETSALRDYKFFCFGGIAKCYKVDFGRFFDHKANYFTADGELMRIGEEDFPLDFEKDIPVPYNLEKMKELAARLSKEHPFLRTDFYDADGKVYFGELAFYPSSGFGKFICNGNDELLGSWLKLPESAGGGYCLIYKDLLCRLSSERRGAMGLTDYKFFCFNGEPKFLYVATGSADEGKEKETFLDLNWDFTSFKRKDYPEHAIKPRKPMTFSRMVEFSRLLSRGIPFLRVDFYEICGSLYFGELTFTPGSGFIHFSAGADEELGELISL